MPSSSLALISKRGQCQVIAPSKEFGSLRDWKVIFRYKTPPEVTYPNRNRLYVHKELVKVSSIVDR